MSFKITLTKKAATELKKMQKTDKKVGYGLKFDAYPAGCMGLEYYMDFAKKKEKDEETVESQGLKIFVPKNSLPLVNDCKIDYISEDESFKIDNPNTKSGGCGGCCGSCGGCNS
ncbi:MAG: iron-sulfur cluster assembly accessory protein [Candidatus Gracilibacteria bacterium]|jgi:iron-sulfur cluster assembly accessory protein